MFCKGSFCRRHKIISGIGLLLLAIIVLTAGFLGYRMIGPYRSYQVDFVKVGTEPAGVLQVGVAKRDITPNLAEYDAYEDTNNNNAYDNWPKLAQWVIKNILKEEPPKNVDKPVDSNKNGKFDPVWIAGFGNNRPAKKVHDPLWARAIAVRNNGLTLVMVTTDSIGIFHDKYIAIRKSLDPSLKIDHVMFSSLHNHETPDTMGNWSGPIPIGGFDHKNMARIQQLCKEAIEEAVRALQPADMQCVTVELPAEGFVRDSRKPEVTDRELNLCRFVKHGSDETIGTLMECSNHPETLGGDNPELTSDFCGYWRDGVENGVLDPNGAPGVGGMALYFQGMVGGLMTQLGVSVPHRNGTDVYKEDSWEKAQALGDNMALVTLRALRSENVWKQENPRLSIAAKTIYAPMGNPLFKTAILLGLIHPGVFWTEGGISARSEVDALRIGDVEIATAPGELYPEIAMGGVEARDGRDFVIAPVEVPPLRTGVMNGKMKMVIGLANDEIGYIIPKSQWDAKPPWTYGDSDQYGEENSGGPDVAPVVHHELQSLFQRLHSELETVKN